MAGDKKSLVLTMTEVWAVVPVATLTKPSKGKVPMNKTGLNDMRARSLLVFADSTV